MEQLCVAFNLLAVNLIIARIHHQKNQFKRHIAVTVELLHQLRHQHRILTARDTYGNLITGLDQLISLDSIGKGFP